MAVRRAVPGCESNASLRAVPSYALPVIVFVFFTVEEQFETYNPRDDKAPDEEVVDACVEGEGCCCTDDDEREASPYAGAFVYEFAVEHEVRGAGEEYPQDEEHGISPLPS